jgi:5-hydroxyisourate hydrolase
MATVSSHILDSVTGGSADGIRVQLLQRSNGSESVVFDVKADGEGRIAQSVEINDHNRGAEFELVMHSADYFSAKGGVSDESMVRQVVIRLTMDDDERRYHLPVMLSPHSYSTWWSG